MSLVDMNGEFAGFCLYLWGFFVERALESASTAEFIFCSLEGGAFGCAFASSMFTRNSISLMNLCVAYSYTWNEDQDVCMASKVRLIICLIGQMLSSSFEWMSMLKVRFRSAISWNTLSLILLNFSIPA